MYPQQSKMKQRIILLAGLCVFLILGLVINTFVQNSKFRVTKTDPDLSEVASASPFLKLYFNRDLNSSSMQLDDPDDAVKSTAIGKESITLNLQTNLKDNKEYTIIIKSLKSTDGEELKNKKISFTAQDVAFDDLPKEQQKASIDQQDEQLYEPNNIDYKNFDSLLDYGITAGQLGNIEQLMFDYSNLVKKQFRVMTLDKNSIVVTTHTYDSEDTLDKADFDVTLGGETFKAHAEYDILYDSVHLTMTNSSGTQVYDSAQAGD